MCAFANTPNKSTIRQQWNLPILERWYTQLNRPLSYFGLTGPEIKDLLDWKHLLGARTSVESPGRTKKQQAEADEIMGRLLMNVMINNVSSGFQLLRSDIEEVILDGHDRDGNRPQMNDGQPTSFAHFKYDIINLDFDGGLGYRDKRGTAKRVAAIKKLFERQAGYNFILFLTINVRDTLGEEIDDYLRGLGSRDRGIGWADLIDWYLSRPDGEREYKLKATVPSFIHAVSEPYMFRSICRPPIVYEGYRQARMIHFAFEFESWPGNLRAFSTQDDRELIELPLIRCENGQLSLIPTKQHPGFDIEHGKTYLQFLPEATCMKILNSTVPIDIM